MRTMGLILYCGHAPEFGIIHKYTTALTDVSALRGLTIGLRAMRTKTCVSHIRDQVVDGMSIYKGIYLHLFVLQPA